MTHEIKVHAENGILVFTCSCRKWPFLQMSAELSIPDLNRLVQNHVQCSAISRGDGRVRCEFEPGHGPVTDGRAWLHKPTGTVGGRTWDHGAPEHGTYWMEG